MTLYGELLSHDFWIASTSPKLPHNTSPTIEPNHAASQWGESALAPLYRFRF